jgi:hypothetical protein
VLLPIHIDENIGSDHNDCCAICLSEMTSEDCYKLPLCSHNFHATCITTWFSRTLVTNSTNKCPVCRSHIIYR